MNTTDIYEAIDQKYSTDINYLQSIKEFLESVAPYLKDTNATKEDYQRLFRLCLPERIIEFKVMWVDDQGVKQHNVGYRVQFNSARGPYKGGLRFDPSVSIDVLKFLGFEQTFKNALTGLPLGGGKGGSDFNPKGKSGREIQAFCSAFMTELYRHIGSERDVPAGDIGVGSREIGYLYGAYKKIANLNHGTLTGKGIAYGGSAGRTEATGHGVVYFLQEMLEAHEQSLKDKRVVISGAGNVATHVALKCIEEGAVPVTLSDRAGVVFKETGFTTEDIKKVQSAKEEGGSLADLDLSGATFKEGTPWHISAHVYVPSATQNELDEDDARVILKQGAIAVVEGANMPCTPEAVAMFREKEVLFAPAKAANAGGVAVSGLEMIQNATHQPWTAEAVDEKLQAIMQNIHTICKEAGQAKNGVDYVNGANLAGYKRVDEAVRQLGW